MTKNLIEDTKSTELEKKRLSKYAQSQSLSYTTIAVFSRRIVVIKLPLSRRDLGR